MTEAKHAVLFAVALSRCIREAWEEVTEKHLTTTRDVTLLEVFLAKGGRAAMKELREATGLGHDTLKHSLKRLGCKSEPLYEGNNAPVDEGKSAPVEGVGTGAIMPSCEGKSAPVWGKNAPVRWVLPKVDLLLNCIENKVVMCLVGAGISIDEGKIAPGVPASLLCFLNNKNKEAGDTDRGFPETQGTSGGRKNKTSLERNKISPLKKLVPLLSCSRLLNGVAPKGKADGGEWARQQKDPGLALHVEQGLVAKMNPFYLRKYIDPWERQELFCQILKETYREVLGQVPPQVEQAQQPKGKQWGNAVFSRRAADATGALYEHWIREGIGRFIAAKEEGRPWGKACPDPGCLKGAPALEAYQEWEGIEGPEKSDPKRYFGEPSYAQEEFDLTDEIQQEYFARVYRKVIAIGRPTDQASCRLIAYGGLVDRQLQLLSKSRAQGYLPEKYPPGDSTNKPPVRDETRPAPSAANPRIIDLEIPLPAVVVAQEPPRPPKRLPKKIAARVPQGLQAGLTGQGGAEVAPPPKRPPARLPSAEVQRKAEADEIGRRLDEAMRAAEDKAGKTVELER